VKKTALAGAELATALATGLATGILLLAGCGATTDDASTDDGSTDAHSSSSAPTSTSTGSSAPSSSSASSASPAGPARCTIDDLKVTLGPAEGAAGSTFLPVRLTNSSSRPGRTGGFGGVSLVISPRSEPVGAPADRVQQGTAKPIVLKPGGRAEATLRITEAGSFSAAKCRPTPTQGLRVYPPNETHAAYVPHRATACASKTVHLLELRPYQAG
jgi:hypothetical protein